MTARPAAVVVPASFTRAALEVIEQTGIDPVDDLCRLLDGNVTPDELLAECLQGTDGDCEPGWRDYVSGLAALLKDTL